MSYPNKIGHYRDGLYRRHVKRLTTANQDIPASESGYFYYIPDATTVVYTLPKISSKWLGVEFTFFIESEDSSADVKIKTHNSSESIQMNFSSVVDNHTTVIMGSTFATGLRVTAVSTAIWMGQPITANSYSMSSAATDNLSGWTTG